MYPKFKTRYNISVATELFSKWLVQFEYPGTDVITWSLYKGDSRGGDGVVEESATRI